MIAGTVVSVWSPTEIDVLFDEAFPGGSDNDGFGLPGHGNSCASLP